MTNGKTVAAILLGLVGLGVVAGVLYALYLIGAETIRIVIYILAVPAGLALILLAAAPVIRAWRTNIQPEKQVYHHTRETCYVAVPDVRLAPPAPTLPQLPALAAGPAYPELLRAAFLAGALQGGPYAGDEGAADEWARDELPGS